jgi:CheY-like chemotaxis protein
MSFHKKEGQTMSKILLADSDIAVTSSLARQLRERGIEVFIAADAIEAPVVARKFLPDAVLINSRLAGGGGKAALKRIRCNAFTSSIPILMLTTDDAAAFIAAGAQECIAPPLTVDTVQAAVARNQLQSLDFTLAPAEEIERPQRIAALHETALLDTPPEESFDRLTRLASRLLGAGSALVSLVDKDRQFFKSQTGLAEPWAGARQTRLSHSFCQWVVSGRDELVVQDANDHPALKNNLAVRDLGVIAYAGIPLTARGGEVIGSFCAIHSTPRAWSGEDLETLRDLRQISEAYAALSQARKGSSAAGTSLETTIHVAGKVLVGAARLLRRYDDRIAESERLDLIAIVEEQGRHLDSIAPDGKFAAG